VNFPQKKFFPDKIRTSQAPPHKLVAEGQEPFAPLLCMARQICGDSLQFISEEYYEQQLLLPTV
jgi:hypothetical protein